MKINLNGRWNYIPLAYTCIYSNGIIKEDKENLPSSGIIELPANWETAGLHDFAGRIEFSREFNLDLEKMTEKQVYLRFNGVDYFAKIFLNGKFIGEHEGYFQSFEFNVTDKLKEGTNKIKVIVDSPMEDIKEVWPDRKRLIKGVLNHHDARPGGWKPDQGQIMNTGGIWNDVYLEVRSNTFIDDIKWIPIVLSDGRAKVNINVRFQSFQPGDYQLFLIIDDQKYERLLNLKQMIEERDFIISFSEPKLWWTWDIGEPYLYNCRVELSQNGKIISSRNFKAGIRNISYNPENGEWTLNNERIFLRGTNIIPTQWLSTYTAEKIESDLKMIRQANINSVRVHAHITRDEFYSFCDEAGILVWQDFPLQWSYNQGDDFTENAVRQIKDMIDLLYNHVSIGIWCCHNEPSINTEELDPVLSNIVSAMDSTRHVHQSSDFREHPYYGWYLANKEVFMTKPCKPLITEFGAQAMPNLPLAREICGDNWPPDWKKMLKHNFQYDETFNIAQIKLGDKLEEFINNSQEYQANLLKYAIEYYRMDKYNNLGSIYQFMFVDCWPAITWSVVDYNRNPKKGYYALQKAFQPVLITAWFSRKRWIGGKQIELNFNIINDYHQGFEACHYKITLENSDSKKLIRENRVRIKPDSAKLVEKYYYQVPKGLKKGKYTLQLKLFDRNDNLISVNDYTIEVVPQPPYKEFGLIFNS